jgi:hypothetical protein
MLQFFKWTKSQCAFKCLSTCLDMVDRQDIRETQIETLREKLIYLLPKECVIVPEKCEPDRDSVTIIDRNSSVSIIDIKIDDKVSDATVPIITVPIISDPIISDPIISDPIISDPIISDPIHILHICTGPIRASDSSIVNDNPKEDEEDSPEWIDIASIDN